MKSIYAFALIAILLASCTSYNKIIRIEDNFKKEQSIRLLQELKGFSDEKHNGLCNGVDYMVTLKTLYLKPEHDKGHVTIEIKVTTDVRPEELDSVIYIEANEEILRFYSQDYASRQFSYNSSSTQTTTSSEKERDEKNKDKEKEITTTSSLTTTTQQSSQIMKRTFDISPELWVKLAKLEKIMIRCYIETEGVNVKFSNRDRKKLARFFNEAIEYEQSLNP
jgi:hypothetical protein